MKNTDKHKPLTSAKTAAKDFMDSLATEASKNGGNVKVSVVKFASKAAKVTDWKNIVVDSNLNDVKNAISGISIDDSSNGIGGGTNMQAGLKLAANRLGMSDVKDLKYKYVIMFSDGGPTFRYTGSSSSTDSITDNCIQDGNGTKITKDKCNGAIAGADAVKSAGGNLYSLFLESDNYTINKECYEVTTSETTYKYVNTNWSTYHNYSGKKFYVNDACDALLPERVDNMNQISTWSRKSNHSNNCKNCNESSFEHHDAYYIQKAVNKGSYTIENLLNAMSSNYMLADGTESDNKAVFTASSTDDLAKAFNSVLKSIKVGSTGAGWTVTDPMSEYVTFASTIADNDKFLKFDKDTNTLTWVLDPEKAGTPDSSTAGKMVYNYTYTYHVTFNMDTFAANKADGANVPTNDVTTLTYDGKTLNFNVPMLTATAPTYLYSVYYYKKDKITGEYSDEPGITIKGCARLNKTVTIAEVDCNYADAFKDYFYNSTLGNTSVIIKDDESQNVMKLYYDPIPASIDIVKVFVTINDDEIKHLDGTIIEPVSGNHYVGDGFKYEALATDVYAGNCYNYVTETTYENANKEEVNYTSVTEITKLVADGVENDKKVVNNRIILCFERDARADASVVEVRHYTNHTYKLNDTTGRYISVDVETKSDEKVLVESQKATTQYTILSKDDYTDEGWTLVNVKFNNTDSDFGNTEKLVAGKNTVDVYYEKNTDWPATATVKVIHNYSYTKWYIDDNGDLESEVVTDNKENAPVTNYRIGETYTATADNKDKSGKEYTASAANMYSITVDANNDNNVINLYYTAADVYPVNAGVTVNHIYKTKTVETVVTTAAAIDDPTKEVITGTTTEEHWTTDYTDVVSYPTSGVLYQGQKVTVNTVSKEGYTFKEDLSDSITDVRANNQTLNLIYVHEDTADNRSETDVRVEITYLKSGKEIKEGELTSYTGRDDGSAVKTFDKLTVGNSFEITETDYTSYATFKGNTYTAAESNVTKIDVLQSGTNVIYLTFERDVDVRELKPVNVTVKNVYRTWNMTVENGVAGYYAAGIQEDSTEDAKYAPETGYYVGQRITVTSGEKDNYSANSGNPALVQTLTKADEEFIYNYDKKVELPKAKVTVNTHFTTIDINVNGTENEPVKVDGTPTETPKYVGEDYTGSYSLIDGFTSDNFKSVKVDEEEVAKAAAVKVTVGENGNVIDFYFEKINDKSVGIEYAITHNYITYDWDGTVIDTQSGTNTGTSYATIRHSITPATMGGLYVLNKVEASEGIELTYDNTEIAAVNDISFNFIEGKNEITLTYARTTDTRVGAEIIINHHYSSTDTYTGITTDDGTDTKTLLGNNTNGFLGDKVYVGAKFIFTDDLKQVNFGEKYYNCDNVSPAAIDSLNERGNVIDVYYSRTFNSYVPDDEPIYIPVVNPPADDKKEDKKEEEIIIPEVPEAPADEPVEEVKEVEVEIPEVPEALPKTGTAPIALFFGLGGLCLTCGAVLVVFGRRKENN